MAAIVLSTVMDAIAATARTAGVTQRAFAWPDPAATPPCLIVGYPTTMDFDVTFKRGSDRAIFPVWFLVGKVVERTARDALSAIITGATGVKDKLDGNLGGVVQTARIQDCQIETVNLGGVDYLAARFDFELFT